jgi:uncharacterized radical SAM superfamily Fe-S cluster-containing enzyme
MEKTCAEHARFEEVYWGSYDMFLKAQRYQHDGRGVENPTIDKANPECPYDCGICRIHMSHSALGNIVITNRCDLNCWYCFFFAERAGYVYEPTLTQIRQMARNLRTERPVPCNAVQLTGGEPTMRDDLIEIIRICKEEGIEHVQLNTDGVRLSLVPDLAKRVREAGVNTVYMSFDGTTPETNPKNHFEIPGALANCRRAGVGIVLVPTIIRGVNDHDVGEMVRFSCENIDVIRGLNFQPVSLVGRMPQRERERYRITIPDLIERIEEQTSGEITGDDFYPVPSCMPFSNFVEALTGKAQYQLSTHFACGMATYVFLEDGKMIPLTRFVDVDGLFEYLTAQAGQLRDGASRYKVGVKLLYRLRKFIDSNKAPKGLRLSNLLRTALFRHDYQALGQIHHKSLFIGMMHFQDLYNWDIERVKRCAVHYATPDGKIIPFCTFNVIPTMYRDRIQREFSVPINEWEQRTGRKLKDDFYRRVVKAETPMAVSP